MRWKAEAGGRSTVGVLAHGASQTDSRVEYTFYKLVSDTFLLYEVQMTDVLTRIARHYGVPVKQLKKDNQFLEQLTVAGDVLFIRNPQTTEPYTFKLDPQSIELLMAECLYNGYDYRDFFEMEPVNMANP